MQRTWFPLLALLAACSGDSAGPSSEPPPLEAVPFGAIGNARVLFQRIGGPTGSFTGVYLLDGSGDSSALVLRDPVELLFGPALAPSGDRVVVKGWGSSAYDIQVMALNGALLAESSFPGHDESVPSWSPDGSFVVFHVGDNSRPAWGIYRLDPGSNTTAPLIEFDHPVGECPYIYFPTDGPVVVSAGGSLAWLCGVVYRSDPPYDTIDSIAPYGGNAHALSWSPDGSELASIGASYDGSTIVGTVVSIITAATGERRIVTVVPGSGSTFWGATANQLSVCWILGGQKLVFNAAQTGNAGTPIRASVYTINADGTDLVRLTTRADAFDHSVSCAG